MRNKVAEMQMPVMAKGGEIVACPVCGQYDDLTLIIDSDDFSETPSFMRCHASHQWAEARFPRRMGAELLALKEQNSPEMIDWSAVGGPPAPTSSRGTRAGGRFRRRGARGGRTTR